MQLLGQEIAPLGMGCWPIGGEMYAGDKSVGYTGADDQTSIQTIHAALDHGITLFDTAAAYGAGHSERLLARALKNRPEAMIITKIGITIDETTKQLSGPDAESSSVIPAINACLRRLDRDCIDMVLFHQNSRPVEEAEAFFDELEKAQQAGKIRSFGWSTDFTASAAALADRDGFVAVEHAMNLFVDAPRIQALLQEKRLAALIRSPLAMGLLSGKYGTDTIMPADDIRANAQLEWASYYVNGKPNPAFVAVLDAIRDLITVEGRTPAQGALGWLWSKNPTNIPVPGARTPEQIVGLAGALEFGPLPASVTEELATLLPASDPKAPDRER